MRPRFPIPHKESTDSEDSIDSETDSIMTATTKELIDTLTKTLKNINQSPTIPLPVFKGKKGEDPEDHILKITLESIRSLNGETRLIDLKTLFLRQLENGHRL